MTTKKRWLVTALGLFLLIAALAFIKVKQIQAAIAFGASFPEPSETVEAITTQHSLWQPSIRVVGEIKAQQQLHLRNEVEGIITALSLPSGGQVAAGEVLLRLDSDLEKAQLAAVEAQITLAQADVTRFEKLVKQQAGAVEQLDRARSQLAIFTANANALRAQIAKKHLIAPFDAHVSIHDWQPGSYLAANTDIAILTQIAEAVWVDFALPQSYLNESLQQVDVLRLGHTGNVSAEVISKNQQINASNRSLQVRAKALQPAQSFYPGEIVQVAVPRGQPQTVITLPITALRFDRFGNYVWVLTQDAQQQWRATYRPVTIAHKNAEHVVVTEGLRPGELIATTGSAKLEAGIWVKIAGQTP